MRIYHNPRCSKSRAALDLVRAAGIEPEIIEYLRSPPAVTELAAIHAALGGDVRQMLRFKESLAQELGLHPEDERSTTEWLELLAQHPQLLERPIVLHAGQARMGRPPERILDLLPAAPQPD